ncbi:MAG: class I SAM-dependent methyltransferase [Armatimonadota bacterium]|nr:MAG: class I SAM-dependent methyltransferase [Armatimonadota bacterium]
MNRTTFFDHHAADWDADRPPEEDARLDRVITLTDVHLGYAVLDVGTGTGVLVPHLVRAVGPSGRIVAIDLSPEMLAAARAKGFPSSVTFLEADVHDLPLPDAQFDRVICNAALPHFEDRLRSMREMVRVLRAGGLLVISHPIGREAVNRRHREAGGPVEGDRVPAPETMMALLQEAGLTEMQVVDEPEFYLSRGRKRQPEDGCGRVSSPIDLPRS